VRWATLDLFRPYEAALTQLMLPEATQLADPFQVCKLANF
jgi:transposase